MTLDELERLERSATPGPWAEFCESGDWWVAQTDADGMPVTHVCDSGADAWAQQHDTDLTVAARNALPALLRVARAAQAIEAAQDAWHVAANRMARAGDEDLEACIAAFKAAEQAEQDADAELRAALAELAP